ncbi:WASH complex subunit 2 isoform X2 [Culex pipiens pallens]|nr:WASH complex subunit 2 isoform X2 [Culex pipiens pallens]
MALPPDELRKRIPQWSLESDGQLLQYMVQISKNLEQKCKQTQDNLGTLLLQLDETHIRFANASNTFNGVQQVKFVENRVKDDDESFYSVREEVEEPGERLPHADVFQMAVEQSITNMYKCFEKVTVELGSDSDSEDEDEEAAAVRNTVLRAVQKYPYIRRPLPHIIGSREWREKWHAGLIDSEEEEDGDDGKEQYSDSSEDTDDTGMFASQATSNHTPSESEGSVWGVHADPRRKRAPSVDPSVSGDDTMSVHSATSSVRRPQMPQAKVPVLPAAAAAFRPPSLFPEQPPPDDTYSVSSRTKVANLFEESDEEESTPTHQPVVPPVSSFFRGNAQQQQQQQARKTVNLFEDEPPPADSDVTPSTSQPGAAKKPVNLFIESDDDGGNDDSFNNNFNRSEPKPKKLDDALNNNDDEDDLFVPVKQSVNGATRRIANLFDDEPPLDDFDEIFKPKGERKKPVAGGKLVLPPIGIKSTPVASPVKKEVLVAAKPSIEVSTPKKGVNLFDEEDDEEMFKPTASTTPFKPKVNLFDDEDSGDEVPPVVVSSSSSKPASQPSIRAEILKKKSIFDSDSDEEDDEEALFGSVVEKAKEPEPLPRTVEPPVMEVAPSKIETPVVEVSPVREKPPIPDEPPEEEEPWDVPPDDEFPHVSNDIDYFLTTNTISGGAEKKLEEPLKVEEPPQIETVAEPPANLSVPEPKSALSFNSIGLFDDVPPPDDDEFDEVRPSQQQPSAGGDPAEDIFGSRPNSGNAAAAKPNHRYLFMDDDGPPPDDRDEVDERKQEPTPPVSTKISAIIGEMRQKGEVEEVREKPKINRLSAKVNINVNALLPGARRPATAPAMPDEPEVPEVKPPQAEPELGTGKLTQLNKGRAKIQTKRKPPSRQTRRANYESSLEQDVPAEESSKETRVVVGSEVKPQHVEVIAAHIQIPNQLLASELTRKLAQPKLFEDEDLEESKPLPAALEPKKPAVAVATPKASSKLFSDDETDDDDLFGKLAKTAPTNPPPPKQVAQIPAPPKPTPSTVPPKQSIFDESDDDDDLFSKSKPAVARVAPAATSTQPSKPKPPSEKKVKSIFSSDEDSDDIFGSSKKKALPPPKAVEKKTATKSLFGTSDGDDDDEDDLFGTKSKAAPKPTSSQPKKPDKPTIVAAASAPAPDDPLADLLRS